ncbi:MAG: tyrosine-type recombinase/integrase, partial [Mycobacterium sp.]
YHGAIRAWCLWLVRTKRREDDPTLIATPPRVPKRRPRPLADEHLAVLLSTGMHQRTRAMILLGAYAGMRVGEIAKIRGEDVDLITRSISVTGKGDKRRDVPMHPVLQTLAACMPPRSWWFPTWVGNARHAAGGPMLGNSVSAVVSRAMDRAGIPGTPHALRHWFGTALRAAGVDSLVIKELMGHESLATTAIYVDVPLTQRTNAIGLLPELGAQRPVAGRE